jgi:hypothetical protein
MSLPSETITVFYSSPDDNSTPTFKRYDTFKAVAEQAGRAKGVTFHVLFWKDQAGGLGLTSGQDVIDERVKGYDVYFGFLSPSRYGKGTVHEYEQAVKGYIKDGTPKCVYFGFDRQSVDAFQIDIDHLKEVRQFRSDISTPAKFGRPILHFDFLDERTFRDQVLTHLCVAADEILARVRGGIRV